jgi:branched-chain amino acid transport system permease protein
LILAVLDWPTVAQLTANGVINGTFYGLLGVGFALILGVTGRFHYAYGFIYTLTAYMAFPLHARADWPLLPAVAAALILTTLLGVGTERLVYRPLAAHAGATALLAIFVASLGIGIAGENLVRLFWSSASQALTGINQKPIIWGGDNVRAIFLNLDLYQVLMSIFLVVLLNLLMRYTPLGRAIKATRSNPEMATIIGINPNTIYLVCFAVGTFLAGVAAFWRGIKFTVAPDMGFTPVIFAFVVAFLAGTARSPIRVFLTGLFVSFVEQYSSIWLSARWTQTAVFVILLVYLVSLSVDVKRLRARFNLTGALARG